LGRYRMTGACLISTNTYFWLTFLFFHCPIDQEAANDLGENNRKEAEKMRKIMVFLVIATFLFLVSAAQAQNRRGHGSWGYRGSHTAHNWAAHRPGAWGHHNYRQTWRHRPGTWGHRNYRTAWGRKFGGWGNHNYRTHRGQRFRGWGNHNYRRTWGQRPGWGNNRYHRGWANGPRGVSYTTPRTWHGTRPAPAWQ
jgi:hypothetical protein